MPWQGVSTVDLRVQFVIEFLSGLQTMSELAAAYDVSRKTGYKWVERYERAGPVGLLDRSRRPARSPTAVAPAVVAGVLAARQRKPYWGARKLRQWLITQDPRVPWPGRSTIHTLLRRHGAVRQRSPRRHLAPRGATGLRVAHAPNDVWTVDFKGSFRVTSGVRCYPLTLRDLASRYTLRCDAQAGEQLVPTRAHMARAFATYGLPACIRSDNGHPFAGTGVARLSRLAVWWMRLGIQVERIAPGRPDQNGAHEQFHRVLKAQTTRPPAHSLPAQQRRFDRFRREYNEERPHEALDDAVPASRYRPSPRPLPARLPPLEYPGHWEPRRVSTTGTVSWRGRAVFLSEALAGEVVAWDEIDDGIWTIYFGTVPLARWLERGQILEALRAQ